MRIYAERPLRATRQLLGDLLAIAWVVVVVLVAMAMRAVVLRLQAPAQALSDAGDAVRGAFDGAARSARQVPFVGQDLAGALGAGTGAGTRLADAGREQLETIGAVATGSMVALIVIGVAPVLLAWVPLRLRYARAARSAVAAREGDRELLALRALARQPVRRLLAVTPDPAAAWRRGDEEVLRSLAAVELRDLGLDPRR